MLQELSVSQVFLKSFAMWILMIISIVCLTYAIERIRYFMRNRKDIRKFCQRIKKMIEADNVKELVNLLQNEAKVL